MIPPTSIKLIDYSSVALQGNTEIKLINNSAAELVYGFGNDSNSFAGTQTVYSSMKTPICIKLGLQCTLSHQAQHSKQSSRRPRMHYRDL